MSFDRQGFLNALAAQCKNFNLECAKAWEITPSIFAASIRKKGDQEWTTTFYFDEREVKQRDEESGGQFMDRTIQLLLMAGFSVSCLTEDLEDHVRIAYFEQDDPIGADPEQIVNYASQLFVGQDNEEVEWPEFAKALNIQIPTLTLPLDVNHPGGGGLAYWETH